jgi:hypothetical protein
MFSVEQSVFISNIFAVYVWHGKNVAGSFVKIFHINSAIYNSNIQNNHACLEAFIATKLNNRLYGMKEGNT